jgi:glucose-6-phosphate isomerase
VHSDVARFAASHYLGYKKHGQNIHVCMPYTDALSEFGFWFCQLWSESLGKSEQIGPTPVAALGATDQHSELQLYLEGPKDKLITFIKVNKFETEIDVPADFSDFEEISYFQNKKLSKLNHAELEATAKALKKSDRAYNIISIPKTNPESLGALFMFYELACAYMGELLQINAHNQPGVQLEKKAAKLILSK